MRYFLVVVLILLAMPLVLAERTVKTIELPLAFISSVQSGVEYSDNVTFDPPDRVSEIVSLEFIFRGDFLSSGGTTVTFRVVADGGAYVACNPSTWVTPVGYDQVIYFDCSDVVTDAGFLTGTRRVGFQTNKAASNLKPVMRVTYYNDPRGTVQVSGTEYEVGDRATTFLQLADDAGSPVNDAACYISIYYPEQANSSHAIYIERAPMLYKEGSDGVYFYDLTVPNVTGVYMLSATCSYVFGAAYIYYLEGDINYPTRTSTVGTHTGSALFLNDFGEFTYTSCQSGGTSPKVCDVYYDFNLSTHFSNEELQNVTSLELFYMGEATYSITMSYQWWNWSSSSWVILPNTLIFSGKSSTAGPTGLNDFQSNIIPIEALNNVTKIIRIRAYAYHGVNFYEYSNWLNIRVLTAYGTVHELKGSSEMHVTAHVAALTSLLNQIWTWLTETLWLKILGMEQTLNATYNNTNIIMTQQLNGTGKIAEVVNQSTINILSSSCYVEDQAKIYVQALKGDLPVDDLNCILTAYYPNGSSYIEGLMSSKGENGLYYYDVTPQIRGSYPISVKCENGSFSRGIYVSGIFQVSPVPAEGADQIMVIG